MTIEESLSENQKERIAPYVTNVEGDLFALHELPEVIKGALFSRYSRSSTGLRALLIKEFISEGGVAVKKAQDFYDRILDGYGDDSIGELGGAHLALENISMLAAKVIQDCRIGGSPLEKSTRYVPFDKKVKGEYPFYREGVLMASAHRDLYLETCNDLFATYSRLIPPLTLLMEERFPRDLATSQVAYTSALRAKVLDCLRGILPVGTLTNMGLYGNGRFFETLIQKLRAHPLLEMQHLGEKAYEELFQVIPSFVRRGESTHKYCVAFSRFTEQMREALSSLALPMTRGLPHKKGSPSVSLIHTDPENPIRVAAALLFPHTSCSLPDLQERCRQMPRGEMERIFEAASQFRTNRRHKSPRALEHASFTFEILADFGIYRDLQRHRMLTQERQLFSCAHGFTLPEEIQGTPIEDEFFKAMEKGAKAYEVLAQVFPEEAQYVIPMAYNIRWYFHINLRALQWMCELRSSPAGHSLYRMVVQEMVKQVISAEPSFECFFAFVDFSREDLGRLEQEIRTSKKKEITDG